MDDVYNNIDDYKPRRKRNILIAFDDMIADVMTNNRFQCTIKELFIRWKMKYISCFYHTVLFQCSKRCQIKFNTLPNNENS